MSKIIYSDYYISPTTVPVEDVLLNSENFLAENSSDNINKALEKYIKTTGLKEISIEKKNNIINIISDMITKMFEKIDIDSKKIRNIFYTSFENYDYNDMVNVPSYLQAKHKLFNASVMILNQHCSSTLQAIRIADSFNKNDSETYSLIISPSFLGDNEDRYAHYTVMGDGAAIMLVGNDLSEGFTIIDNFYVSDGYVSYYCYENQRDSEKDRYDNLQAKLISFQSTRNLFDEIVKPHKRWFDNSKFVVIQNISKYITEGYSKSLGISIEKFYEKLHGGHIGDVDIIRNLKDLTDSNSIKKGDEIILFGAGGDFKSTHTTGILCKCE